MFEKFIQQKIDTGEVTINTYVAGDGPPLLLLHGRIIIIIPSAPWQPTRLR
jgi:hypothetical protein